MCGRVHQVGILGGTDYDSKDRRLEQLLERVPASSGAVAVFATPASASAVRAVVARCCQGEGACVFPRVDVIEVASTHGASVGQKNWHGWGHHQLVINYDVPATVREYLRRLSTLYWSKTTSLSPAVAYTFIEEEQLNGRPCREFVALLRRVRRAAAKGLSLGGMAKAIEFDSALGQLVREDPQDEGEEDGDVGDSDDCDCAHCRGCAVGGTSFHLARPLTPTDISVGPVGRLGAEVVRMPLRALEDLDAWSPLIAPRMSGHVCTIICLHMLYVHTPWDGWEHVFALPELGGNVRVIMLLAEQCSWHDYPDQATLCYGGVPWADILDVGCMEKTDALLERLIDHEAELLHGRTERIVLFGVSQGGGQSMLRFLRSRRRLGGWVGAVCHVPTAPHTQRAHDPLLTDGRPLVNRDTPVRLLAGEQDSVFPPGIVLRDAERLRSVGGFSDVQVEVQGGLCHEGFVDDAMPKSIKDAGAEVAWLQRARRDVPELVFLREHLRTIFLTMEPSSRSASPESC